MILVMFAVYFKILTNLEIFRPQKVQQRWYEKLHDWENALNAYEKKYQQDPNDSDLLLGRMRCLEALGEW